MTLPQVGFAGLTHLGLVSAAAAAAKGCQVIGFDPDRARVDGIVRGQLPVTEPGLAEILRDHRTRLNFSHAPSSLATSDVVYISNDVPTDEGGVSDLSNVLDLVDRVLPHLRASAVVVVLCQVPPGFTRALAIPAARCFYQVETLVFGLAVERALHPERFIVGCVDPDAPLPSAYAAFLAAFGCPILPMRYESAELAKIAINCFLAASVTTTNTLADMSERVGADWAEIAPALRLDRRIGPHAYLTPSLGLAGGNVERDLATVSRLAADLGAEARVVSAFVRDSRHRRDWALRTLHAAVFAHRPNAAIAVLGLAYKADTQSTKNSAALGLIRDVGRRRVRAFDPIVPASIARGHDVVAATSPLEAAVGADALAIMTPWPIFRELKPADLSAVMAGQTVLDPYRVLDGRAVRAAGMDYFTLGRPPLRATS